MSDGGANRRQVLLAAGAVGAAGVLAACGDEPAGPGPDASATPTPSPTQPPAQPSPTLTTTSQAPAPDGIPAAEIPVGGGRIYTDRGVVVTQPAAGEYRAFDIVCPHQGCFVGEVSDGRITCPCHGSQFAITDGSVLRGPVTGQPLNRGLTPKTATVSADTIVIS